MADRLLRHPVPNINESIGNYILRLCSENSCEVNQISDLIGFNPRGIENYYRKLKKSNITKLSELTGIDTKVIEEMTANRFCFHDKYSEYNDFSRGTEACVCPKCYSDRSYERIHWKNKLIKVCLDHEIYLVNECPRCKEKITSNILFNGKCDCGLLINDFKSAKCSNEYVLQNQNILYQIFNIKSRASFNEYDLLYCTLSGEDYCHFLCHLQDLATLYDEDLSYLEIFENDRGFKSNIIASWVMLDWPANLIKFLDILNCLDIKYINRSSFEVDNDRKYTEVINDRFIRIFNPLGCLKLNGRDMSYMVFRYKEIYQPIINYYYENSNKQNVKKKMDRYIYLNDYVELDIAIKIFFDIDIFNSDRSKLDNSDSFIIKEFVINYFHVYKYFNKEYLNLEEIFNFYNKIKKICSISFSDIKEILGPYNLFLTMFEFFGITLSDIIQVQMNRTNNVRIDPINFQGLKSIYYRIKQTEKELLLMLANRIDVTD